MVPTPPCSQLAVAHDTRVAQARLAQPVERKALNLVVVGSSPTVGVTMASPLGMSGCCVEVPAGCWRLLRPASWHSRARVSGLSWPARVSRPCRGPGAPHASHQLRPHASGPGWPAPGRGPQRGIRPGPECGCRATMHACQARAAGCPQRSACRAWPAERGTIDIVGVTGLCCRRQGRAGRVPHATMLTAGSGT